MIESSLDVDRHLIQVFECWPVVAINQRIIRERQVLFHSEINSKQFVDQQLSRQITQILPMLVHVMRTKKLFGEKKNKRIVHIELKIRGTTKDSDKN